MPTAHATMRGLALDPHTDKLVRLRDDLALPSTKPGEILVRVTHATVNGHEFELANSRFGRFLAWISRAPGEVRTGLEFAGIVDSEGDSFRKGDAVMGYVDMLAGWHPHADYVAIPEAYVASVPRGMPLAQAAALPMSALTALVALRDVACIQPGQRVLVLGASGGVGVMAVQIARIFGAEVTAIASAPHHERLASLGAQRTIDYSETPIAQISGRFDAILEFSNTLALSQVEHLLTPTGVFVPADPIKNLGDVLWSRHAKWLMVDKGDGPRLREIAAWVEEGRLEAVISETFELEQWERAVARSHERGRIGRTVLQFDAAAA